MAETTKDEVLIEKTKLEVRLLAQQLTPSYRRRESAKTIIGASGLIIALVTLIGGLLSVASWFVEQKKTRQVRAEERLDHALVMASDENPSKRLAGVVSLRSFTREDNDTVNLQVLQALSGRLALEDSTAVRSAILFAIEDLNPKVVSTAVLNIGLQFLAETSRSLMREEDIWSTQPEGIWEFEKDSKLGVRLAATAQAMVAMLRKGARTADLSGVYFGASDLSGLDLAGTNFDDAILALTNFTDASLAGDSFNGSDLQATKFVRADLRNAKFALSDGLGRFGRHHMSIQSWITRSQTSEKFMSGAPLIFVRPNFACSDLRNADFKGQPLFTFIADNYQGRILRTSVSLAPDFQGANLDGTDLRGIRFLAVGPENKDPRWPLNGRSSFRRFPGHFGKGYMYMIMEIEPDVELTPSAKEFSRSFHDMEFSFTGSNWRGAQFPAAIREWLEDHPPRRQQIPLPGEKPCEPRAKWKEWPNEG